MTETRQILPITELLLAMALKLPRKEAITEANQQLENLAGAENLTIGNILEKNALKYKDRPAIRYENLEYSHSEFNALVNQYANVFQSQGVKKGKIVVVFLENRLEALVLIAALAKLGAIASMINANQRGKVLQHSIKTDMDRYFVIGEERIAAFEEVKSSLSLPKDTLLYGLTNKGASPVPAEYLNLSDLIQSASAENPVIAEKVSLTDRFANVFTSGTTGMPKASMQTHLKWVVCYYWYGIINMGLQSTDVLYVPIPFFHTNAMIVAWPAAAAGGAALAIRRKLSISNFWKDVQKYNVSAFIYIGEICRYLMNKPPAAFDSQHRIRAIVGNGLRPDIWKAFKKRFNIREVYELYGASDGIVSYTNVFNLDCTVGLCRSDYAIVKFNVEEDQAYRNPQGFMEKVNTGEAGLLLGKITEITHFPGYVNSEKNREKILENVFEPGDQWFNTGDLIRDIGFDHAQFVDRLGDTFRWKGENVSTAELEAIINQLPQVAHSAVYGVALPQVDGKAGMATLLITVEQESFDLEAFTEALIKQLPHYAIPLFIRIAKDLDKTATHKIKKAVLKKEGINIPDKKDALYVLLPNTKTYRLMTPEIFKKIERGEIAF